MTKPKPKTPTPHGTAGGYTNHRCRCDKCRTAWAAYNRDAKASRERRLKADPTIVPHGRASTYGNWRCRCDPCTAAWAEKMRRGS